MEYSLLLIPVIFLITLGIWIYLGRNVYTKTIKTLQENPFYIGAIILIPIIISFLVIHISSSIIKENKCDDIEYLSYYITKLRHTDAWNEYIHRTCTRRVYDGTDKDGNSKYHEEEYDCSYVENHPERWILVDNTGDDIYVDQEEWDSIKNSWKSPMIFVDMHRNYYTQDGDAQDYYWPGTVETIDTYTTPHHYKNILQGAGSTFLSQKIENPGKCGLYDYPGVSNTGYQNPIIGDKNCKKSDIKQIEYINGLYGKIKQIHVFVLVYSAEKHPDASIGELQEAYWQRGNKNEFVICVGINRQKIIRWAYCFSWLDNSIMEVRCRDFLYHGRTLDYEKLGTWLKNNMKLWNRKQFHDFDYLSVNLNFSDIKTIFWIITIICILGFIGFLIWMTKYETNEYNYY